MLAELENSFQCEELGRSLTRIILVHLWWLRIKNVIIQETYELFVMSSFM